MTRTLSLEAWQEEGRLRFGHADSRLWLFVCPSCGQEQAYRDLVQLGVPHPEHYFAFACIGRFNLSRPERADEVVEPPSSTRGFGCTYHSGTRDHIAPVIVEISPGELRPTFGFAP